MAPRPRVVLITGAPGSGKSALGVALARELRVPFLARDDVRGGLFLTGGGWSGEPDRVPTSDEAVETFLSLVEQLVRLQVSCVVEYVVRRSRPGDLDRLLTETDVRVIVTTCRDGLARFARREASDRLLNQPGVVDALGYRHLGERAASSLARRESVVADMRTDFPIPVLTVATDDGYEPGIEEIVRFAARGAGTEIRAGR